MEDDEYITTKKAKEISQVTVKECKVRTIRTKSNIQNIVSCGSNSVEKEKICYCRVYSRKQMDDLDGWHNKECPLRQRCIECNADQLYYNNKHNERCPLRPRCIECNADQQYDNDHNDGCSLRTTCIECNADQHYDNDNHIEGCSLRTRYNAGQHYENILYEKFYLRPRCR